MKISITPKTWITGALTIITATALVLGAIFYPTTAHAKSVSEKFECTIENVEKALTEIEEKIDELDIDEMPIGELIDELNDITLILEKLEKCVNIL